MLIKSEKLKIRETQNPGNLKSWKPKTRKPESGKLKIQKNHNLESYIETQNPGNPKSGKLKILETKNPGNPKSGDQKIQKKHGQ